MRKRVALALVLCLLSAAVAAARGDASRLEPDSLWPAITLPLPVDLIQRRYLGIEKGDAFTINAMPAEVVVVQIFSMYCPICQREAPRVNRLHELIAQRGDMSRKLKIIGIGAGNSDYEVDFFRHSYSIPFPLIADENFFIHKKVGEVRTPHFFVLRKDKQGQVRLVFDQSGGFKTPEAFLMEIIKRCGLE